MPAIYDYNGYKLVIRSTNPPKVQVYKDKKEPALYEATSLDQAMKWVDENKE
jgi:hypothetical protein